MVKVKSLPFVLQIFGAIIALAPTLTAQPSPVGSAKPQLTGTWTFVGYQPGGPVDGVIKFDSSGGVTETDETAFRTGVLQTVMLGEWTRIPGAPVAGEYTEFAYTMLKYMFDSTGVFSGTVKAIGKVYLGREQTDQAQGPYRVFIYDPDGTLDDTFDGFMVLSRMQIELLEP